MNRLSTKLLSELSEYVLVIHNWRYKYVTDCGNHFNLDVRPLSGIQVVCNERWVLFHKLILLHDNKIHIRLMTEELVSF